MSIQQDPRFDEVNVHKLMNCSNYNRDKFSLSSSFLERKKFLIEGGSDSSYVPMAFSSLMTERESISETCQTV